MCSGLLLPAWRPFLPVNFHGGSVQKVSESRVKSATLAVSVLLCEDITVFLSHTFISKQLLNTNFCLAIYYILLTLVSYQETIF